MKKLSLLLISVVLISTALLAWACTDTGDKVDKTDKETEEGKEIEGATTAEQLLWKISGNGLEKPSYLLGTIHIMDKRVAAWPKEIWDLFYDNEAFVLEVEFNSAEEIATVMALQMLPDGKTLKDYVSEEEYQLIDEEFAKIGIPIAAIETLKPFFTLSTYIVMQMGKEMPLPLDKYLEQEARTKGMDIIGLEAIEEQIGAIDKAMTIEEQAELLVKVVSGENSAMTDIDKQLDLYLNGDIEALFEETMSDESMPENFGQIMIIDRNNHMADRIDTLIQNNMLKHFIAIGSGHLGGEQGVVNLLKAKGYEIEAVPFTFVKDETE